MYKVSGTITLDITIEQVGAPGDGGGGENPPPPPEPPPPPPAQDWKPMIDERLAGINARVIERAGARYKMRYAWLTLNGDISTAPEWARSLMDTPKAGADHHCFGRALRKDGSLDPNAVFILAWPGGSDQRLPEDDGWANIPIYAGFDPKVTEGPYTWSVRDGDTLAGVGLPNRHHVTFWVIWQER